MKHTLIKYSPGSTLNKRLKHAEKIECSATDDLSRMIADSSGWFIDYCCEYNL